jgi:tetratricopeptide (TPR) repeat protein
MKAVAALVASVLAVASASAAEKAEPTLKELRPAPPDIRAGEQVEADAERTRQLYRRFLELDAGDPELTTEALRRLGDLAMEAGDAARGDVPAQDAGVAETRAAIEIYTRLLEQKPDYAHADAVLYQLARAWEAEGLPDRALVRLDELVTRFPGSAHFGEAQFRRGEILFSAQRWHEAEMAYAAVIATESATAFHDQALYKHGWALFKQSETESSARSFLTLLDGMLVDPAATEGTVPLASLARADREVVEDTLRVLSIQFAALDGGASLDRAVDAHGVPPYAWLLYASLGDLLVEKERYTDAADAYRSFVRRDPTNRHAPELQGRAIDAYLKGGFAEPALAAKQEFVGQYGFDGPFWQGRDRASAPEVATQLQSHLRDVARYQHATAQASGLQADYMAAAASYRKYLGFFPEDPQLSASNYMLADVLFEAQDYRAATQEYERTAYDYPANDRSAEAAYAALVSYGKHESSLAGDERASWHLASIESSLRFAAAFPKHPQAGSVRLRAAQQLFNLGQFDRASATAMLAASNDPPLPPGEIRTAWNIVADSAFETGRYAQAETAYREVLSRTPVSEGTRREMSDRLAATVYKQGEARQREGDAEGAIADFLRVGTLAPDSPIRATAEYDAAALLIRAQQWERAIPVLEAFRRDYADHPMAATVPQNLALAYGEAGRPLQAAAEYERVAGMPTETDEVRRNALVVAADLYEQGGDAGRSAAVWERYVERYPQPLDEAQVVRLKLADMALAAGRSKERTRWLEAIVAADAAAGPGRTDTSRLFAARASLELATPAKEQFESVALKAPLARTLKSKRAALEKALAAYQAAVDYGVAEVTTAATYATAELYRRLAVDLMASERPRNLDAAELEQYDLLLEEQAYPFEERAIELHETNVARAAGGLYDESVRASFAALAGLKPARYARGETLELLAPRSGAALPAPAPAAWEAPFASASAAAATGDWESAEQQFGRALEAGGGAPAMTGLALAYRNTGRFALAESGYRSALEADPDYAPALLNLGVLLDLYLQQPAAALEQYLSYQAKLSQPDARVAGWIKEVEIRAARVSEGTAVEP